MQIPLQVSFRDISHSDFVERRIHEKVEKLKKYSKKITSCRVIVATPHRQRTKGKLYHVSIDLRLPGNKIVVARDPDNHSHENVYIAVRDAYGWQDIELGHGFHDTKQGARWTISPEAQRQVLDRLLALNHERYELENGG